MAEITKRKSVVWTKVRIENARELSRYEAGNQSRPLGKIELRYPSFIQSGKMVMVCACCGERADTVTLVEHGIWAHYSKITVHKIPCCKRCKGHEEAYKSSGSRAVGCFVLVFGFIMLYLIAIAWVEHRLALLYLIPILIVGELLLGRWISKEVELKQRKAQPLMGERCTDAQFCSFKRGTKGVIHEIPIDIFRFSNREYAVRFCEMNAGTLE
jgi:hypothetical protein